MINILDRIYHVTKILKPEKCKGQERVKSVGSQELRKSTATTGAESWMKVKYIIFEVLK